MTETSNEEFVTAFKKFYHDLFYCIADNIDYLAKIQKDHSTQYKKIINFSENPAVFEELVSELPLEQQGILLRILLKAGDFGRKFAIFMEMSPKQKGDFADDLRKFAAELDKM